MVDINDDSEKRDKSPRITEIAVLSLIVSILVFVTNLLSNSVNIPSWWFYVSLVVIIGFMLAVPLIFFARQINAIIKARNLERKRNAISRKYASVFKDIMLKSWSFNSSIYEIFNVLRTQYKNDIKSTLSLYVLENYEQSEIGSLITEIREDLDKSNKTFRDLCLINKRFDSVLKTLQRNLKIIEVFAHEIIVTTGKPIAKGIEDDFEAFREKYNLYINSVNEFNRKINQETGTCSFNDGFELLKKW